jgi:hypothetical protein
MKRTTTYSIILFLFSLLTSGTLHAQTTVTLKPINGNGKDALIVTQVPTANYGTHPDIEAITWTCSSVLCLGRSLMEFDLSFIPAGSVINSATLNLYANLNAPNGIFGQPTYGNDNAGILRRITQGWNENTVTWNNQPTTTSQNEVTVPQSIATNENYSLDVTQLTQDIIDNPSAGYGFMISEINETTWYNSLIFGSSDNSDTSLAPSITITYTAPSTGMICFELQPSAAEGKDALIVTQVPTANYGTHPDIEGITWTCSSVLCLGRGLIEFDLTSIPATATIDSAFLYLYANPNAPNGISGQPTYGNDNAGYLRRITQSWNEMTVTWNTQPTTTNQDEVVIPQSTSSAQDYVLDIKNMVQTSVLNPNSSFGFMLMEQNETTWYNSLIFGSSDEGDASIHPKLKVCYTPSTGIRENDLSSVSIYPNPFSNSISIVDGNKIVDKVEIYNSIGEVVLSNVLSNHVTNFTMPLPDLAPGIYFVKLYSEKGNLMKKIIRN